MRNLLLVTALTGLLIGCSSFSEPQLEENKAVVQRFIERFLGILRFEERKIAEMWVEWDNLNILTQLGHFPLPGEQ